MTKQERNQVRTNKGEAEEDSNTMELTRRKSSICFLVAACLSPKTIAEEGIKVNNIKEDPKTDKIIAITSRATTIQLPYSSGSLPLSSS
jgi:hypothetical protein